MIDVSGSLYQSLPQAFAKGNRPVASENSLIKPDESLAAGNSLRAVTAGYREDSGLPDFSEKPRSEQGFLSLGPVLASLRPEPPPLYDPLADDGPTIWEQLLEEQKRISDARAEARAENERREKARSESEDQLTENTDRVKASSEKVIFQNESQAVETPQPAPAENDAADQAATQRAQQVLNAIRTNQPKDEEQPALTSAEIEDIPLPGQGENIEAPDQPEEKNSAPEVLGSSDNSGYEINSGNQRRRAVEQAYGAANPGTNSQPAFSAFA